nr:unnamed protein product [Digitaria exilis]
MSSDDEVREEKELDLSSNDVVTKYKSAAEILNTNTAAEVAMRLPKLLDEKQTTIYKRAVDKNYHLKMKASRFIFSEISQKFPIMPFTARALEEKRARLGLVECMNHELLQPYPVLHEKPDYLTSATGVTAHKIH